MARMSGMLSDPRGYVELIDAILEGTDCLRTPWIMSVW
jgi:hypothetical protein